MTDYDSPVHFQSMWGENELSPNDRRTRTHRLSSTVSRREGRSFFYNKRTELLNSQGCRHCTNSKGILLLIGVGMVLLIIVLSRCTHGNTQRLLHAMDSEGRWCGIGENKNRPWIFWPSLSNTSISIDPRHSVCVDRCYSEDDVQRNMTIQFGGNNLSGVSFVYPTAPYSSTYCFPEDLQAIQLLLKSETTHLTSIPMEILRGLKSLLLGWQWIGIASIGAILCGFFYIYLMQAVSWNIISLFMTGTPLLSTGVGIYLIVAGIVESCDFQLATRLNWMSSKVIIVLGFGMIGFGIFLFCALFFIRDSMHFALNILQCSADCFWSIPSMLIIPATWGILTLLIYSLGLVGLLKLLSATTTGPSSSLWDVLSSKSLLGVLWLLGILWSVNFLHSLMSFLIAYTVAVWYFTLPDIQGERKVSGAILLLGLQIALRYHIGTLCVAAAVFTLGRGLHGIVTFLLRRRAIAPITSTSGIFRRSIEKFLTVCERIFEYVNQMGLIECAINGTEYFAACQVGYHRVKTEVPSVFWLHGLSSIFTYVFPSLITISFSTLTYYTISNLPVFSSPISPRYVDSPIAITCVVLLFSSVILRIFTLTFDQISDSILYCFLVEQADRPDIVYAPDGVRSLVEENDAEWKLAKSAEVPLPHQHLLFMGANLCAASPYGPDGGAYRRPIEPPSIPLSVELPPFGE